MIVIAIIFWSLLFVVFYTYAGYGIVLYTLVKLKETFGQQKEKYDLSYEPEVTLFIAAYNEKDYIDAKIKNSLELD